MLEWIPVKLMPEADIVVYHTGKIYITGKCEKRSFIYEKQWQFVEDVEKKRLAMLIVESGKSLYKGYAYIPSIVARDYLGKHRLIPLEDKGFIFEPIKGGKQ